MELLYKYVSEITFRNLITQPLSKTIMFEKTRPIFSIWPNVILTICICLTFIALSLFAQYDYQTDKDNHALMDSDHKLEEVRDRLDLLSDLLTVNAALVAETGDQRWIIAYEEAKGEWAKIIAENPDIKGYINPMADSLLKTEVSVLNYAKQKNLTVAQQLINSIEYQRNEEKLDKKLDEIKLLRSNQAQKTVSAIDSSDSKRLYILWAVIVIAGIIWFLAFFLINLYRRTVIKFAREIISRNELLETSNAELIKINIELDNFVYAASHQLASPIKSSLGLITAFDKGQNDMTTENFLEMLQTNIAKTDANLRSVIFYAENSRSEILKTEFNLESVIKEVLTHIESEIYIHDISIVTDIEGCSKILSDQNRLRVIILCLLSNAAQYQNPDGKQKRITVKGICNERTLELEIEDNGIGIPNDKLASVFGMFVKLNNISAGPGLGLYIVTEILKKLLGTVQISSVLSGGTVIKVVIPI